MHQFVVRRLPSRRVSLACITALFFASSNFSQAQTTPQSIAKEMLVAVCGPVTTEANSTTYSIKGDAEAKLSGLVKKLADLGITGAASFEADEYVGVLRSELSSELKSVRDCNLKVWPDVRDLATGKLSGSQVIDRTINSSGDGNGNVSGDGNSVNIQN